MLEGLDNISWEDSEKIYGIDLVAYGSVEDLSVLVRKLLSKKPEERSQALGRLYEVLMHQGLVLVQQLIFCLLLSSYV